MKKLILLLPALFFLECAFSQNLVENPDFEIYGAVPCGWTGSPAIFASATSGWTSPTNATPDIFSQLINVSCSNYQPHSSDPSCNGYQAPHSGDIFGGFYTYVTGLVSYREYLQGHLTQPLVPGETYRVSMYISLSDNSQFATDNMGVGFSTTLATYPFINEIGTTPEVNFTSVLSDTSTWVFLCDTIVATAAWEYFIIGNYYSDANTIQSNFNPGGVWDRSYYYCDDVTVEHINIIPVAMFSADNHICPGVCVDFTNNSTGAISYIWNFPGANPSVSTDEEPTGICYNTPGTYPVTLIADNGVTSDTLTLNNFMTVYPFPSPQGINQSGDTLFAIQGASSYQWNFDGNIIPGATDYYYVATMSGNYSVVATDNNGCEVEAVITNVIASVQYTVDNRQITSFPNPVTEILNVRGLELNSTYELSILNVMGEKVFSAVNWKLGTVNCAHLSNGLYYIEIISDKKIYRTKFVKQ